MTTAFASLQAALLAALSSAPALAGGNIGTNRLRPIPTGQSTALVLRLDASEGTERVLGCVDWQTAFTVECYARGASSTTDLVAAVGGPSRGRSHPPRADGLHRQGAP